MIPFSPRGSAFPANIIFLPIGQNGLQPLEEIRQFGKIAMGT